MTTAQFRPFLEQAPGLLEHYPAQLNSNPDLPQTYVTWYEAAHYCNWRSQQEGIPPDQWCYEPNSDSRYAAGMKIVADFESKTGFRLPTEAEWEYACRAGTVTRRSFGESDALMVRYACCLLNAGDHPLPVGSLLPNAFGLFDIYGNVFEWCQGGYSHQGGVDNNGEEIVDDKVERLVRGGGFFSRPSHARSANRYKDAPVLRNDAGGFRLVRSRPRLDEH